MVHDVVLFAAWAVAAAVAVVVVVAEVGGKPR